MTGMYVVHYLGRGYLTLNGPFAYPVWIMSAYTSAGQGMSFNRAHAYALAYGGEVKPQ